MIDPNMIERVEIQDLGSSARVAAIWRGVDRPFLGGVLLPREETLLIDRLRRCMESGAFWAEATIRTDLEGRTYVHASALGYGKGLGEDLKRLGY